LINLKIKNHFKKQQILEVLFYLDYRSRATFGAICYILARGASCNLILVLILGLSTSGDRSSHWGKVYCDKTVNPGSITPCTVIRAKTSISFIIAVDFVITAFGATARITKTTS